MAADRDLIFGLVIEDVLAYARGGLDAVVRGVDVDETAPVFGEFLMADYPAETPDGGLVDGAQRVPGAGCALAVMR